MDLTRFTRKIALTLFLAMSFGSAALIAAGTVNPIVGADLSGTPAWAGAPGSLLTLGTALAALALGLLMERVGRRWGMVSGLALGLIGSGISGHRPLILSVSGGHCSHRGRSGSLTAGEIRCCGCLSA